MINSWKKFNESINETEFRYSKSDLLEVISDLIDEDLVHDIEFNQFYYNSSRSLSRTKMIGPGWKNKPLYMFSMSISTPYEFIPVTGLYFEDVEFFHKIYKICEHIKSWSNSENLTFLHKLNEEKLILLFIQND